MLFLQEIEVLDDLVVALKLVPDRDGATSTSTEEDDAANDNSIADTEENKENINNSAAAADSSGSQNPVRLKDDWPS